VYIFARTMSFNRNAVFSVLVYFKKKNELKNSSAKYNNFIEFNIRNVKGRK